MTRFDSADIILHSVRNNIREFNTMIYGMIFQNS